MNRRMMLGGLVATAVAAAAEPVRAAVSVSIGIDLPAPPVLVSVPASPVLYAPAVNANYFLYGGQYYVFTSGLWYVGPRYNGPWAVVAPELVPRPILGVPVQYYRVPPPAWRQWHREAPPRWAPAFGRRWEEHHERRHEGRREEHHEGHRDDRR